ncbi:MAG TPA: hypothetical protein PLA94_33160, partial [Myxococcota bacterium]|nr:hypothetical protein [Myxococcota bacterium]
MSTEAHLKQQIAARRRGLLLLTLNAQYPGYLVWSLLVATLGPVFDGNEALLRRELALLVDKKLVAENVEKLLGQRTITWR